MYNCSFTTLGKTMVRYEDTEPLQETLNEIFEHPEPLIGKTTMLKIKLLETIN